MLGIICSKGLNRAYRHLYGLMILTSLTLSMACEPQLPIDPEEVESRLVILSNFTDERELEVQITGSQPIIGVRETNFILDAQVTVYDTHKDSLPLEYLSFVSRPSAIGGPVYRSTQFRPKVGKIYLIEAEAPGFAPVSARSYIPLAVPIRGLKVDEFSTYPLEDGRARLDMLVHLKIKDQLDTANFYHLSLAQQFRSFDHIQGDTIEGEITRTLPLEFMNISKSEFVVRHYEDGLLMEDQPFDGREVVFDFSLTTNFDLAIELPSQLNVELRTVSEDYYLFHSTLSRQQQSGGTPLSEPVFLYENVQNGGGIFAGYSSALDSIKIK